MSFLKTDKDDSMIVDCNVNNATEPLTKKLRAMLNTEKPFIVKGPSKIKQDLQRT